MPAMMVESQYNDPDVDVRKPLLHSQSSINQDISTDSRTDDTREMSRTRIIKNLLVISFSLFLFFLGFAALANLQSTMNSARGLGMDSQALIYASSMLSSLLLSELFIKMIGCKRTLVYCVLFSVPYIACNFVPRWETLMPSAALIGLGAGPLSTSQALYLNEISRRYHGGLASESLEVVMARFYGVFSFFAENTQIWGNLVAYYVLRPKMLPLLNSTRSCGINFTCHGNDTNPNLQPPDDMQRYRLVGIYVLCGVMSVILLTFFLDPLGNDIEKDRNGQSRCRLVGHRLLAAVKHARVLHQLLLLPLTVLCGLEIGFYTSDFTQAYIACSWGVHHVGFVTICFGVCGCLVAVLVGPLVKCISQAAVILLTAALHLTILSLLFVWQPSPDYPIIYFVFSGAWGMCDALWWSQIPALYGLLFPNEREAAFSNFFFWSFLGYFLSYSYANYFSVVVKLVILLSVLVTGVICFVISQAMIRCSPRKEYIVIEEQ